MLALLRADPLPAAEAAAQPAPTWIGAAGTTQLGGTIGFQVDSLYAGEWSTAWSVAVSPELGYFVKDCVEITATAGFRATSDNPDGNQVDLGVGMKYLFGPRRVLPYLGAAAGVDIRWDQGEEGGDTWLLPYVEVPVGVLFPIGSHVALDVGLRPRVGLSFEYGVSVIFELPVTVGIQGYF